MPYKGHVENGVVVMDDRVDLPEGTIVELYPVSVPASQPSHDTMTRGRHHPDVERFAGIIAKDFGDEEQYYESLRKKHA